MPKLEPTHQIKVTKKTIGNILQGYGLVLQKFTRAKGGIQNTTCLVETNKGTFVLRVYIRAKKTKDVIQELEFMNFLAKHRVPVPEVFADKSEQLVHQHKLNSTTWNCVLMQHMKGEHPKQYTNGIVKELAKTQARMHALGIKFAKTQTYKPASKLLLTERFFIPKIDFSKITSPEAQGLLGRIKKYRVRLPANLPKAFCHLDFDHGNILIKNSRLSAILDFDDLKHAPIVKDLSYTMWDMCFTTEKTESMFLYLNTYLAYRDLSQKELSLLKSVILFRHYCIAAFEILFWGQRGIYVKKFLRLEKIILQLTEKTFMDR